MRTNKEPSIWSVFFIEPVLVRTRSTTRNERMLTATRAKLSIKGNFLLAEIDGFDTLIPLTNVSSIHLKKDDEVIEEAAE